MNYQTKITTMFNGLAFKRPLFYHYPLGLRFALSDGGNYINQFISAFNKASVIMDEVFSHESAPVVCLRCYVEASIFSSRYFLKELQKLSIKIPKNREYWVEVDAEEIDSPIYYVNLCYEITHDELNKCIWAQCATDYSTINPQISGTVYLFNFNQSIMVWLYDDRGMDVVGPNKAFLAMLYQKLNPYLLDYDKLTMQKNFECPN